MRELKEQVVVNISEDRTIIELSEMSQKFSSEIYLSKIVQGSVIEINLKSFLGLINLQMKNGDVITVRVEGDDSEEALREVVDYLT